jgi:uncharacterized protein (DUF1697 family)
VRLLLGAGGGASTIGSRMAGTSKAGTRRQTWVALLRGINLGARNKISTGDLRELVSGLGAEDVTTYLQSGNVVFRSSGARRDLTLAIESEIGSRLGLDVTVVLRTKAELAKLVAGNPFADDERDESKLHVTFLAEQPTPARVATLEEKRFAPDELRVTRGAVYLHCPEGYGRSKLSNTFFEKQLDVPATTRNWRTVTALADRTST